MGFTFYIWVGERGTCANVFRDRCPHARTPRTPRKLDAPESPTLFPHPWPWDWYSHTDKTEEETRGPNPGRNVTREILKHNNTPHIPQPPHGPSHCAIAPRLSVTMAISAPYIIQFEHCSLYLLFLSPRFLELWCMQVVAPPVKVSLQKSFHT
jgi:hypothetical protein